MNVYMGGNISVEEHHQFARSGRATQVADWVIALGLSPESHVLYMRVCRIAELDDPKGVCFTITQREADHLSGGDGNRALKELVSVGALTKVAMYTKGEKKIRFRVEIHPPEVRALREGYRQAGGLPVVSYA